MRIRSLAVLTVTTFAVALFGLGLSATPAWAQAAELTVDKTGSPGAVVAGEEITYTIVVTNTGDAPALLTELFDFLPEQVTFVSVETTAGTCAGAADANPEVTCELGTLDPGEGATVTITARARTSGRADNVACARPDNPAPPSEDECRTILARDTAITTIYPELDINKLDDPDPVNTEDTLLYTLRVTNVGGGTANDIVVTDFLDLDRIDFVAIAQTAGFDCDRSADVVRCTGGDLAEGQTARIELIVEPEVAGIIENTATVGVDRFVIAEDTETTTVEGEGTTPEPDPDPDPDPGPDPEPDPDPEDPGEDPGTGGATGTVNNPSGTATGDVTGDGVSAFSCVEILQISTSAAVDQYEISESRLEECRVAAVIDDTVPEKTLAATGGLSVVSMAALLLVGVGIFVGRSVLSGRGR